MEQLRRAMATVQTYLGGMNVTQKLLVGSLSAVAVLALLLVTRFGAKPDMVPLTGVTLGNASDKIEALKAEGINARYGTDGIYVDRGSERKAVALLGENGDLPADTSLYFDTLIANQDWRNSREQNRQQFVFALQNELGKVISGFKGVSSASVIIDDPAPQGLGRAVRSPSASVTVFSTGGGLSQETVDAVAGLVAGARSGLTVDNVRVIDGSTGRQRQVRADDSFVAGTYLEHRIHVENEIRSKLEGLLGYIPGVMVAVTADVDVAAVSTQTRKNLPKDQGTVSLVRRENKQSKIESSGSTSAEPGIRSNQPADINYADAGSQVGYEETEGDTEFENHVGTEVAETHDPRGMPTFLAASVNIPEAYIIDQVRRAKALGAAEGEEPQPPTQAEIESKFTDVRDQVQMSILPHVKTRTPEGELVEGEINVSMVPVELPLAAATQAAGLFGMAGGDVPVWLGGGSVLDTALIGGLALVAVTMMVMMVKKSSKRLELPSAEELVGKPPALQMDADLLGDAAEDESAMAGIEVNDAAVNRQAVLDQVSEMVRSDPDKAAKLMGRWLALDN